MKKHVDITITGKVHNVGYRFFAIDKALEFNVSGLVKNTGNDTVIIEAEGEVEDLKNFMRACKTGPQGAVVKKFDYKEGELRSYSEFAYEGNFYSESKSK